MMRPLTTFERCVKVPAGILWLAVMAVVAVPVILYMTALAYVVEAVRGLRSGGSSGVGTAQERD
jgi:hypothetical protein